MPEAEKRAADERLSKSSPVYPAVEYVRAHMQEMVKMVDMAHLCHLSPSYFSRVFHREMGEKFINWMNRQKIDWKRADRFISKTDKYRRDYYRYFTGQEWENMRNYDLCINTTAMTYEQAARAIEDFAANMLGWNRES